MSRYGCVTFFEIIQEVVWKKEDPESTESQNHRIIESQSASVFTEFVMQVLDCV